MKVVSASISRSGNFVEPGNTSAITPKPQNDINLLCCSSSFAFILRNDSVMGP